MSRLPFFKSMFLLSRQACFLTRTLRNTFLLFILHKKQSWRNLKLLTKTMDLLLWKNSNFAFFIKICSSCLWTLLFYLEHQQTLFLDLFLIKTKEKKKTTFWPNHRQSPLKKCQSCLVLKSMFLSSRQACFLTRTSPNVFSLCILHKTKRQQNFKFLTKSMDQPLSKNGNFLGCLKRCFHSWERFVFYIKRRKSFFHDLFLRFIIWGYKTLQGVTKGYRGL